MIFPKFDNEIRNLFDKERIPILKLLLIGFLPSKIKIFYYRLCGFKICKKSKIGFGSLLICKRVEINQNVTIGHFVIIKSEMLKIGPFSSIASFSYFDTKSVKIGADTRIRENVMVGGLKTQDSNLIIGDRCIIMQSSFLNTTKQIEIGDDSGVGGYSLIFTHASWLSKLDGFPVVFAPVKIGKFVWLPWRVFIMPGVTIGDNVVAAANSTVSTLIPPNCLISGSPARIISKNYPRKISNERKNIYVREILLDFITYLKHKGFSKIAFEENLESVEIFIKTKKKTFILCWFKDNPIQISVAKKVNIYLYNRPNTLVDINSNDGLFLNYDTKERIGSDILGEVFLKFLSRYGIRFKRILEDK